MEVRGGLWLPITTFTSTYGSRGGKLKLADCRGAGSSFGSPEGCSLGGPAVRDRGGAGFLSYQRVPPNPPPALIFN